MGVLTWEARGHLAGIGSVLLQPAQILNPDDRAWLQVPLPAEALPPAWEQSYLHAPLTPLYCYTA